MEYYFRMKLSFSERTERGTRQARGLRTRGLIPVVCYGAGNETGSYTVTVRDLQSILLSDAVVIDGDGVLTGKKVLVQEVDYDPRTDIPRHADFIFVDERYEVEHEVPIQIIDEAPVVKSRDGQMVIVSDAVLVKALPKNLPSHLDVSVAELSEVGSRFVAGDVTLPLDVVLVTPPGDVLISIVAKREEEVETSAPEPAIDLSAIEVSDKKGKQSTQDDSASDTDETATTHT